MDSLATKPIIEWSHAKHYGFTDLPTLQVQQASEDLDFIINCDIKYLIGRGKDGGKEDD